MGKYILLLHDAVDVDAPPDEQDTILQLTQIDEELIAAGFRTECMAFAGDLVSLEIHLKEHTPDVVFNLVETFHGARFLHIIPALCEKLGIRITGAGATSLFLTSDKLVSKHLMKLGGIPTPGWIDPHKRDDWESFLARPLICKPRMEDASVGIDDSSIFTCASIKELELRVDHAEANQLFIEEYIEGRECNISIATIDGVVTIFPIAEMLFQDYPVSKPKIVGYDAKWLEDSFAYRHTLRSFSIDREVPLSSRLRQTALSCWHVFLCHGYGRVDIRIADDGTPYVLEVNMNPCIARDSGFIAACAESGLSYVEVIQGIVKEALCGISNIS
jgi:D-alanine-D-alanine ligase